MSDESQNPILEENSIPVNPQEPAGSISQDIRVSEPINMPPEAPESPINTDIPVSLNNDNPQNTPISTSSLEETKSEELPAEGGKTEEINPISSEPVQTPEPRTAQIPVNEPFENTQDKPLTSEPEVKSEPLKSESGIFSQPKTSLARELLVKARNMIQFRKRKKLDRVMTLFLKKSKITNDEVREFLHVSDATATRYLSQLEKENKIKQSGKTGKSVFYIKI
jgi:hypothetical protein